MVWLKSGNNFWGRFHNRVFRNRDVSVFIFLKTLPPRRILTKTSSWREVASGANAYHLHRLRPFLTPPLRYNQTGNKHFLYCLSLIKCRVTHLNSWFFCICSRTLYCLCCRQLCSKPGFFRHNSERRSFKLLELRKTNRDAGVSTPSRASPPSTPSSPDDTPCLSGDPYNRRRRKIPKVSNPHSYTTA